MEFIFKFGLTCLLLALLSGGIALITVCTERKGSGASFYPFIAMLGLGAIGCATLIMGGIAAIWWRG